MSEWSSEPRNHCDDDTLEFVTSLMSNYCIETMETGTERGARGTAAPARALISGVVFPVAPI